MNVFCNDQFRDTGKILFEEIYHKYNLYEYIDPDPLQFVYQYKEFRDREIAGFIASSLAYGRVKQIIKSVDAVLNRMGNSPYSFLKKTSAGMIGKTFSDFKHRFTTSGELVFLLCGMKRVIKKYGSLYACFVHGMDAKDSTILPALCLFVNNLNNNTTVIQNSLLPVPGNGSACKRLNLFLRWVVRKDQVDPGGWESIPASKLIVPLDVHMHRICYSIGLTTRKNISMTTAMEITGAFKKFDPDDPVKYDFALTRLGIRSDTNMDEFIKQWN